MQKIKIETIVHAPVHTVWEHWKNPSSITHWAHASEDWYCPYAENTLIAQGRFLTRMSARDGSASFDFTGTYTEVEEYKKISYKMDTSTEGETPRECEVTFEELSDGTTQVTEIFDSEDINSIELQQAGWQSILNNFKDFVENNHTRT